MIHYTIANPSASALRRFETPQKVMIFCELHSLEITLDLVVQVNSIDQSLIIASPSHDCMSFAEVIEADLFDRLWG